MRLRIRNRGCDHIKTQQIKGAIVSRGMTQNQVARILGIHYTTFSRKLNDASGDKMTVKEACMLLDLLDLDDPISVFFGDCVAYSQLTGKEELSLLTTYKKTPDISGD